MCKLSLPEENERLRDNSRKGLADKVKEYGSKYGMDAYSTEELWALATQLAPSDFSGKCRTVLNDPKSIHGISQKKELIVLAVKELVRRLVKEEKHADIVHGPEDVAHFAMPHLINETKEHFVVMSLNTKNHITGFDTVSIGSLTASVVHPREVFETALRHHAASIILLHNHPSGDPDPSREDINITQKLVDAGGVMGIPVLDHVVIGDNRFISLKEKGLIHEEKSFTRR